jgi:hypothetical protein
MIAVQRQNLPPVGVFYDVRPPGKPAAANKYTLQEYGNRHIFGVIIIGYPGLDHQKASLHREPCCRQGRQVELL